MEDYLDVAQNIQGWLARLQIPEKWLLAEIQDHQLDFSFRHPRKGMLRVTEEVPSDRVFSFDGVAFEVADKNGTQIKLRVHDYGGIWDPIDERVMGEHYSTSHFALLSALLYRHSGKNQYFKQAEAAFAFHRHTSPQEYAFSNWMYHWDFQNYAFMESFALLEGKLPHEAKKEWSRCLQNWRTNSRNKLSNWAAMRALAYLQRHRMFGAPFDYLAFLWNYRLALSGEQADGCFDDEKNKSRPIQYHVYTIALLHRMFLLNGKNSIAKKVLKGIDFFMPFIDPEGDFNYWGRGHGQIFGYGAGIYALTAAYLMTGCEVYDVAAKRLFDFLRSFETDGHFPLVLNEREDHERVGWYDYHHTTVYNAFLGVWLALAYDLSQRARTVVSPKVVSASTGKSNFAFLSNRNVFVAVGNSLKGYASEVGLSPSHVWIKNLGWAFSCPGGPTEATFGKYYGDKQILMNFLAPIVIADEQVFSPAGRSARIGSKSESRLECSADYGVCRVRRIFEIRGPGLRIRDAIRFEKEVECQEVRLINIPIVTDKFDISLADGKIIIAHRGRHLCITYNAYTSEIEPELIETLYTPKGVARVAAVRLLNTKVEKNEQFLADINFELIEGGSTVEPSKAESISQVTA